MFAEPALQAGEQPAQTPGWRLHSSDKSIDEVDVIGLTRVPANALVEMLCIVAHQDSPAVGLYAGDYDRGRIGGSQRRPC
jgi:hypothetical protein